MKNAIHTINNKLAIILGQLAIFEREIPKDAATTITDACLDINKSIEQKSTPKLNPNIFKCNDFEFEHTLDAPLGANDVELKCIGFELNGRLEWVSAYFEGKEVTGLLMATDTWGEVLEIAKEKLQDRIDSVA